MKKFISALIFATTLSALAVEPDFSQFIAHDLLKLQAYEAKNKSLKEISSLNAATIDFIENYKPTRIVETQKGQRLNSITRSWAEKVVASIDKHPVVSSYQYHKYNRANVEIGFCFGRATYAHLALMNMGLNRDAIKKIWAVGPMDNGQKWQFHVATIVRAADDTWYAIDNVPGRLVNVREWSQLMLSWNKTGTLRFYITDPEKFSVSLGQYSRVQLGLDLPKEEDWYQHYFVDLMRWFKETDNATESLGLIDLRSLLTQFF